MRIAMMTNNYKPFVGGVPISIERLADSLRDLGHGGNVASEEKMSLKHFKRTFISKLV